MAVSMKVQSVSFCKITPPICFNRYSQLPFFLKFSISRPIKAAATEQKYKEPILSNDSPVLEAESTEQDKNLELPLAEKKKNVKKSTSIYRPKKKINRDVTTSKRVNVDPLGILKYQLITQAAMKLLETENTLVFIVDTKADKIMIREAVEKMCGVQVKNINTSIRPDMKKKAFVKLKEDQSGIDIATKIGIM